MKKLFKVIISALTFATVALAVPALAAPDPSACKGAAAVGAAACNDTKLTEGLNNVIDAVFFIAGTAAVIVLLAGGIGYILSTGDATRITKAKNTILYAITGLIIVILARAIVGFVVGRVG